MKRASIFHFQAELEAPSAFIDPRNLVCLFQEGQAFLTCSSMVNGASTTVIKLRVVDCSWVLWPAGWCTHHHHNQVLAEKMLISEACELWERETWFTQNFLNPVTVLRFLKEPWLKKIQDAAGWFLKILQMIADYVFSPVTEKDISWNRSAWRNHCNCLFASWYEMGKNVSNETSSKPLEGTWLVGWNSLYSEKERLLVEHVCQCETELLLPFSGVWTLWGFPPFWK